MLSVKFIVFKLSSSRGIIKMPGIEKYLKPIFRGNKSTIVQCTK